MSKDFSKVIDVCSDLLQNHPSASTTKSYLDNRLDKESQVKFKFGYFPEHNKLNLLLNYLDFDYLSDLEIMYKKNIRDVILSNDEIYSTFENFNLVLPYRDVYGNIVAMVGRSLLTDEQRSEKEISKYKNTSFEKSKHLFGLFEGKQSIIDEGFVYIVEGQFDCIQAHKHNIKNIVALGSSSMSFDQIHLLLRYTDKFKLLLDNDAAGELGRDRIISKFGRYCHISNSYLPVPYKDLDEFLKDNPSGIDDL